MFSWRSNFQECAVAVSTRRLVLGTQGFRVGLGMTVFITEQIHQMNCIAQLMTYLGPSSFVERVNIFV